MYRTHYKARQIRRWVNQSDNRRPHNASIIEEDKDAVRSVSWPFRNDDFDKIFS